MSEVLKELPNLGLQKTSLSDYPGQLGSVLFFPGCNLRCPYCHNPELLLPETSINLLSSDEILEFLKKRRNVLKAVTISGGEPLLEPFLLDFLQMIKEMGYLVKLDTNGLLPDRLAEALPFVDYVALDLKTSPKKYTLLGYRNSDRAALLLSGTLQRLRESHVSYEIRVTLCPAVVNEKDIEKIASMLEKDENVYLQQYYPGTTLDPEVASDKTYTALEISDFQSFLCSKGINCMVRAK